MISKENFSKKFVEILMIVFVIITIVNFMLLLYFFYLNNKLLVSAFENQEVQQGNNLTPQKENFDLEKLLLIEGLLERCSD